MFIPLEGENIICLADVVALYEEDGHTVILRKDGVRTLSSLSPRTLKKRAEALRDRYAVIKGRSFS